MAETDPLPKVEFTHGYGRRYPHRGHYVRNVAIGLTAFLASCLTIHWIRPFPEIPKLAIKLRYFTAHKDEFDTIFIGSSHVYRGIVPETFDRVAESAGVPTHSFNFGLDGMQPPESLYFLDQILLTKPARLKWVFVELEEVQGEWPVERWQTHRFYYWHNWHFTRAAIEAVIDPSRSFPWWKRFGLALGSETARLHLRVFCKNMGNLGAASNLLQQLITGAKGRSPNKALIEGEGYVQQPHIMPADRAEKYVKDMEGRKQEGHSQPLDVVTDELFRETSQSIEKAGARPVYILPPGISLTSLSFRQAAGNDSARIFAFNDLQRYSELYDLKFRADEHHLTGEGARLFTRLLAERFVREVATAK